MTMCVYKIHAFQLGGERFKKKKRMMIFLDGTRKCHHQSDQHWTCFKGSTEKLRIEGGAYMGFVEHMDTMTTYFLNG